MSVLLSTPYGRRLILVSTKMGIVLILLMAVLADL